MATPSTTPSSSTAQDVNKAFRGVSDGFKQAAAERTAQQIAQNGYVEYAKPAAQQLFRKANPGFVENVMPNGTVRFSPPPTAAPLAASGPVAAPQLSAPAPAGSAYRPGQYTPSALPPAAVPPSGAPPAALPPASAGGNSALALRPNVTPITPTPIPGTGGQLALPPAALDSWALRAW